MFCISIYGLFFTKFHASDIVHRIIIVFSESPVTTLTALLWNYPLVCHLQDAWRLGEVQGF